MSEMSALSLGLGKISQTFYFAGVTRIVPKSRIAAHMNIAPVEKCAILWKNASQKRGNMETFCYAKKSETSENLDKQSHCNGLVRFNQ